MATYWRRLITVSLCFLCSGSVQFSQSCLTLCDPMNCTLQDKDVEKMARDNSRLWVHKPGITSRDINKLTVSSVLLCVFVWVMGMEGFRSHPD